MTQSQRNWYFISIILNPLLIYSHMSTLGILHGPCVLQELFVFNIIIDNHHHQNEIE